MYKIHPLPTAPTFPYSKASYKDIGMFSLLRCGPKNYLSSFQILKLVKFENNNCVHTINFLAIKVIPISSEAISEVQF